MAQRKSTKVAALSAALGRSATHQPTPAAPAATGTATLRNFISRPGKVPTAATMIRMDADLFDRFKAKCFTDKRSMSYVVEQLVRGWVG